MEHFPVKDVGYDFFFFCIIRSCRMYITGVFYINRKINARLHVKGNNSAIFFSHVNSLVGIRSFSE